MVNACSSSSSSRVNSSLWPFTRNLGSSSIGIYMYVCTDACMRVRRTYMYLRVCTYLIYTPTHTHDAACVLGVGRRCLRRQCRTKIARPVKTPDQRHHLGKQAHQRGLRQALVPLLIPEARTLSFCVALLIASQNADDTWTRASFMAFQAENV